MGYVGITIVIIFMSFLIICGETMTGKEALIVLFIALLGGVLIVCDAKSPIEETVTIIETTDVKQYGLKVYNPESKVVRIRKVEKDPIRFGAVLNKGTVYELVVEGEK